jgi:hypothetical protein
MSANDFDLLQLLNQIKGFDVTEFEKSLSREEVEKFRVYIMNHHKMALRFERALKIIKDNNLESQLK